MSSSICLMTGSHVCRNPRVVKEADALSEAGYDVTVLAPLLSEELLVEDEGLRRRSSWTLQRYCDLRPSSGNRWQRLRARIIRRAAAARVRWLGWQTPHALGYGVSRLLAMASRAKYDLCIGHQEIGAWAAMVLGRSGYRVGGDIEDWYSRDLLPQALAGRPLRLLRTCERFLLRHGAHVTTTSHSLADALAQAYESPRPQVLYNCFPWTERTTLSASPRDSRSALPSLHWFSQTIGPGRGLETLGKAVGLLSLPIEVHLRGAHNPSMVHWLHSLFPKECVPLVHCHPLVPASELLGRIVTHDIGLALELDTPDSRNLTVTNKILHYLLAGLPVVASATRGQEEIAALAPAAVRLFPVGDAHGLAAQLKGLLDDSAELIRARTAALEAARDRFCWERQVPLLLESVQSALAPPRGTWSFGTTQAVPAFSGTCLEQEKSK